MAWTTRGTVALRERVAPVLGSTWFLGAIVALLSWPARSVVPGAYQDPSWQFALHFAAEHRLDFGTQVIFTYGPLGFLQVPLVAYGVPAVLSALYATGVQLALGLTVVWAARRSFPIVLALPIALLAATLMAHSFIPTDAIIVVVFTWCVAALIEDPPSFSWRLVVIGGGIVSAIEVLGKLNTGLLVLAMCAVTAGALQSRRRGSVLSFCLAFAASLSVLWFASGQSLGNFDDYVRTGFDEISGYQRGHTVDLPAVGWDRVAAAAMAAAALAATLFATSGLATVRRAAVVLIVLMLEFALLKQAFVFHIFLFMPLLASGMLAPWLAFRWRGAQRVVAVAAIAAISVVYFPLSQGSLSARGVTRVIQPVDRAQAAVDQLRELLLPGRRERVRAEARASLRSTYSLEPASLALLKGRRVAIYPFEFSIAWAYGLDFSPLPVLGTYTMYTPLLDSRSAAALASGSGPQRILRHRLFPGNPKGTPPTRVGLEDRYAPWEGPATTLAMLCHFEALHTTDAYQVLGRTRDRCGRSRMIGSESARYGEQIHVPHALGNRVVFARVEGLEPSGLELVRTALYRSAFRYVSFDGGFRYRAFPDVADDLIIAAPRGVDFPRPFALAANPRTMAFYEGPGIGASKGELTVDFFALPVREAREGGPSSLVGLRRLWRRNSTSDHRTGERRISRGNPGAR